MNDNAIKSISEKCIARENKTQTQQVIIGKITTFKI